MREMIRNPRVGEAAELTFVVTEQHIIDFADDQMPAVLSTPWLVWFLEHTARNAMLPLLEDGESTVGAQVDVRHLAPTPLGQTVTCSAQVIHVDGNIISFSLRATDEHEEIARGSHKMAVVDKARLKRRVTAKQR
jgi:fluoroacetyl-CoA thioesterase